MSDAVKPSNVTKTAYAHIVLDAEGRPVIEGTRMKVSHLVTEHLSWRWSPEESYFQHPHLTLGQVHSALAYYWDHKEQVETEIKEANAEIERMRAELAPSSRLAKYRKR